MQAADFALILSADGSASVGYDEFGLIASGMAAGLRDPDVIAGLTTGPARLSLAAVLIFSGRADQDIAIDWTPLRDARSVQDFATQVENIPRLPRPGLTAIGNALLAAGAMLARAPAAAAHRVVDVAGDGRANDGVDPAAARDGLVAQGVTINGLCVLHEEPDLVSTFEREVIGGPGAFAQTCQTYKGFAEAMRRKLVREIRVADS